MNYTHIYREFIASRRLLESGLFESGDYKERHHIKPVSMGGTNDKENLINLTARDHYFAHCCLAKIYGGKMWSALFAVALMTKTDSSASYFLRGRMVAVARERAAAVRSANMTDLWKSGAFIRNRVYTPHSEETRRKMSEAGRGKKASPDAIAKSLASRRMRAAEFEFVLIATGQKFCGSQSEFVAHSGLSQAMVSCLSRGRIKTAKGWALKGFDPRAVRGRDPTVRLFAHSSGEIFVGTGFEFKMKFNFDAGVISNLINGKNRVKSFKGWRYQGEKTP